MNIILSFLTTTRSTPTGAARVGTADINPFELNNLGIGNAFVEPLADEASV